MTQSTDESFAGTDDAVIEREDKHEHEHEDDHEHGSEHETEHEHETENRYEDQEVREVDPARWEQDGGTTSDESPRLDSDLDLDSDSDLDSNPDETTVRSLLEDGPQGPQGRVAMAAAGIDVDREFPLDGTEEHVGESVDAGFEGPPAVAGAPDTDLADVQEPLLTPDAQQAFLDRWQTIQIGFVEDPAQSVRNADTLMADIATAYEDAIGQRRASLTEAWQQGNPGTEELRQALRQYRSFVGVVLPK